MSHVKNILIFLTIIGVIILVAWLTFQRDRKAQIHTKAIDEAMREYNDSFLKTPALPFLIDHYEYGMAMVDGSTIIPIDMDEYNCWKIEYDKWKIYYQKEQQKLNKIKQRK